MKITFLTVMPSPYVQDLFAALAADPRIELTVWYLEQVAPDTYWGEQRMPPYASVLPGRWFGISGARVHWNPGVRNAIQVSDADLFVIVGYIGLTNQIAMRSLNRLGRPWVFWGEIPGLHHRRWLGLQIRKFLQMPLRSAKGIAAVGSHAVAAYRQLLGDHKSSCVFRNIPYHCRLDEFQQRAMVRFAADSHRTSNSASAEQNHEVRFLYCGQLIERKGVDLLCRAFCRLIAEGYHAKLILAGEGPLRQELQIQFDSMAQGRVAFLGFQTVEQLPQTFGDADVFLLPSRHDGWGVVINQAIAAGLPVIATTAVGACNDLVQHLVNGLVIEPDSEQAIFDAFKWMIDQKANLIAMGRHSLVSSQRITMQQAVNDWCDFFTAAVHEQPGETISVGASSPSRDSAPVGNRP